MNRAKKALLWLKHYILSDTLHGTHSPFVYQFLENIVYKDHPKGLNKIDALIFRMASLDTINNIYEPNSNSEIFRSLQKPIFTDPTEFNDSKAGLVIINKTTTTSDIKHIYNALSSKFNQHSIFIMLDIRHNKERYDTWKELCLDSKNNISIDFFHLGILFFEQAKPKEHFTIYF